MSLSVFIEMTLSAILTVWSPGPNNILLLSNASKYGVCGNLERFPDVDVSFRLVLQYAWKYYSRNSASHEISGRRLYPVSGLADLAQASSVGPGPGEDAYLETWIFPSDDQCQDHYLWTNHVFCIHFTL